MNEENEDIECGHLLPENGDGTCILCGAVVVDAGDDDEVTDG